MEPLHEWVDFVFTFVTGTDNYFCFKDEVFKDVKFFLILSGALRKIYAGLFWRMQKGINSAENRFCGDGKSGAETK